jgi:long-subunit acyl-CoA synthetase (AMP-forming)
MKSTTW